MNKYKVCLFVLICGLFYGGSCVRHEDQHSITIYNNSDKEVIFIGSLHSSVALDTTCYKPGGRREYQDFIYYRSIKPYSDRRIGIDLTINRMQKYPNVRWSVGLFNLIDIDTMSCEEFVREYPIKKEWILTLEDMIACDWKLDYTPEE